MIHRHGVNRTVAMSSRTLHARTAARDCIDMSRLQRNDTTRCKARRMRAVHAKGSIHHSFRMWITDKVVLRYHVAF